MSLDWGQQLERAIGATIDYQVAKKSAGLSGSAAQQEALAQPAIPRQTNAPAIVTEAGGMLRNPWVLGTLAVGVGVVLLMVMRK